ncbi:MAG: selenide, water dikinase SelD [Rhodobacteraceae bacterium]|nr:selenide, water dikinase SelD [Paracoccaceae bacterium]
MPNLPSLTSLAKSAGCAAKIAQVDLAKALAHLPQSKDPNLMVDHAGSDDAAVYRLSSELALVETVDIFPPIVDDPFVYGQIAATNALSDVYAMGAKPISALSFVSWPVEVIGVDQLGAVLKGAADICSKAGIEIAGGHSIVDSEPKFGLFVTGLIHPDKIIDNSGAKVGDYLVLTKKIGTGVLTTAVKRGEMPESKLNEAILSMTTLNADAASVMQKHGIKAATDVTGFGLLGHLGNMLRASSVSRKQHLGVCLSYSKIPKFSEVEAFLEKGLCPLGTRRNLETAAPLTTFSEEVSDNKQLLLADAQTSGGLLMAIPEEKLEKLLQDLRASNVPICAVIGQIILQDQPARIHVEL